MIRATLPAPRRAGRSVSSPHEAGAADPWHARVLLDPPGPAAAAPFDPAGDGVTRRPEATTVAC